MKPYARLAAVILLARNVSLDKVQDSGRPILIELCNTGSGLLLYLVYSQIYFNVRLPRYT